MLKPILFGFVAFVGTAAGIAVAQNAPPPPPPPGGPKMMMRADANADGVITRDEYVAQANERFDRMDANHDGKLDQAELQQLGGRMRGMRGMGGDMPPPSAPPRP